MTATLIHNATVLTVDPQDSVRAATDVHIVDGRIAAIAPTGTLATAPGTQIIDASGAVLTPGFVQIHVHLCQVLFRNLADDLALMDWLQHRIWPMEAAHTPTSLRASADIGLAELLRSGTTCILDMGTVHHSDAIGAAVEESGMRAVIGKCMMDAPDAPPGLRERREDSLREAERLCRTWQGRANGRIGYAFAPRFAISCSDALLRDVAALARDLRAGIHTHASETPFEVETSLALHGLRNIEYLHACGLTGPDVVLAHGVWTDAREHAILAETGTSIAHCPITNLKLGSGIAPIPAMQEAGVNVGIGSDGAPCNNTLDIHTEMRVAALVQKVPHGPTAMPANRVIRMATMDGAKALGLDHEIGSVEVGKKADLVLHRFDQAYNGVAPQQIASTLVYASFPENVRSVWVDGRLVVDDGRVVTIDAPARLAAGREALAALGF